MFLDQSPRLSELVINLFLVSFVIIGKLSEFFHRSFYFIYALVHVLLYQILNLLGNHFIHFVFFIHSLHQTFNCVIYPVQSSRQ